MKENIYCTLDTETFGGASHPEGIYHIGGLIHNRNGKIYGCFNFLILEHLDKIQIDEYAKKNIKLYEKMLEEGNATIIPTEEKAIEVINDILNHFNVKYLMAFNSGFDFCKTCCRDLLEGREFIDIYLMALQTIAKRKKYAKFCEENNLLSRTKKTYASTAESFYAYLTGNEAYEEEHTALEDSKIELQIFLACVNTHLKYTKNCHCWDYAGKIKLFNNLRICY